MKTTKLYHAQSEAVKRDAGNATMTALKKSTKKEIERMLGSGMEQLTKEEFEHALDCLGYYIPNNNDSFNYINSGNENVYYARSIFIADKTSKKSFANIATNNDNLKELQKIRLNSFVVDNGRIWDI